MRQVTPQELERIEAGAAEDRGEWAEFLAYFDRIYPVFAEQCISRDAALITYATCNFRAPVPEDDDEP